MLSVGKLQINKTRKKNVSRWLMTSLREKKARVASTRGCALDVNLIHFPPTTGVRIICSNVRKSEKRSLTAFQDGKCLVEVAAVAGAAHHRMCEGRKIKSKVVFA